MYQPKVVRPADTTIKQGGSAILVFGLEGSGKSQFGIDTHDVAPHLVYLNFDRDVSHLLAKYKGEDYVYEKINHAEEREIAAARCRKIEDVVDWAVRAKEPLVLCIDNVVNWRSLASAAFLPADKEPIPRDYENVNSYLRRCVLKLEQSNVWTVLTAPAGPKWVGEQKKAQEVRGEDLLESKAWEGFDFCVVAKLYLYNVGARKLVRPVPTEEVSKPEFKAQIVTAKLKPKVQGMIVEQPRLKEVWEVIS